MSTPTEQARAVIAAETFLYQFMLDRRHARRARAILRHLPTAAEWANVLTVYADPSNGLDRQAMRDEFARWAEELRTKALRPVAPKKGKRRGR